MEKSVSNKIRRLLAVLMLVAMIPVPPLALAETEEAGAATPTDLGTDEGWTEFGDDPEPVVAYEVNGETAEIQGDAYAEGHNRNVIAISAASTDSARSAVTVSGNVTATGTDDSYSHANSIGADIVSTGEGSEVNVVIDEGVTSVMKWTDPDAGDNIDCAGISISLEDGGSAAVTVVSGGIYSEATSIEEDVSYTWAAGVHLYNTDGTADVLVNGDVTTESTIYGVGLNSHLYGSEASSTLIEVNGDVYGTTRGIWAEHANPNGTMEIIVNGQVSGTVDNILVNGACSDRIVLTVWKLEPDQDGALIRTEDEMEESIPAEEAEKNLQYIIRVTSRNDEIIEADAAEYRGYQVAREGDTVRIRITPPDGSEVAEVFGNEERSLKLERNADGSYILVIPRGGGVDISVTLRKKDSGSGSRINAKVPSMIPTADSAETSEMRKSILDGNNISDLLPDGVQSTIRADAQILEVLTLTLADYTEGAGTPEFILPVTRDYREGEKMTAAFVLPQEGNYLWLTAATVGTADGKLSVCPDGDTLKRLANRTFLVLIMGSGDAG